MSGRINTAHWLRSIFNKYQTPFGIAIWAFTGPGAAVEVLCDGLGQLQVVTVAGSLTEVDLIEVLGAALTSANPVIAGIFDAAGNRMPSMDAAARPGFVDMIDLPAAAALSDAFANPTTTQIGSFLMGWEDGAGHWERVAIDNTGKLETV